MKKFMLPLLALLMSLQMMAQWTNDSLNNTLISDAAGDKGVPKISLLSDHGCYISWYGGPSNYDINLQRLDYEGNAVWQPNGIVVSNHPQETWVTDFDMKTDHEDNAIIVFNDIRHGNWDVFVYKVSPNGEMLFGVDGQAAGDADVADMTPRVCVTSDNSVIIAWMREAGDYINIVMQKFDSQGNKLWEVNGRELSVASASVKWPYLQPTEDGGFILGYFVESGPFWAPDKLMYAMRYDYDGNALWSQPTEICGATGITAWDDYKAIPDGNDGLIAFWQDDRDGDMLFNSAVQHVLSDGSLAFPANGVEVATTNSFHHYYDYATGITTEGDIMIFWAQADQNQNTNGLMGQKVSASGERLWGDAGLEIFGMNSTFRFIQTTAFYNDTSFLVYSDSPNFDNYLVKAIDKNGEEVWKEDTYLSVSTSFKIQPVGTAMDADQVVVVWADETSSGRTLRAQNFLINGDLGQVETGISPVDKKPEAYSVVGNNLILNIPAEAEISVYDIAGRVILQQNVQQGNPLSLQRFAGQLCIIRATDLQGNHLKTEKILLGN